MATQDLQYLPRSGNVERKSSSLDEKFDEKADSASVVRSVQGNVYDDVRDIDLGEDGKERPIGESIVLHYLHVHRLTHIRSQKPISTSLPV